MNIDENFLSPSCLENRDFSEAKKYLKNKFAELADDYLKENRHPEHCLLVALDVAKCIRAGGGKPRLLLVEGQNTDSVNTETLAPKRYEGRVEWGGHTVCENDGIIYDPMVGDPLPRELYLKNTFLKPAQANISMSSEELEALIRGQ